MSWKSVLGVMIFIIILALFMSYYFIPYPGNDFIVKSGDVNAPSYSNSTIQFYPNMRFPDRVISYRIVDCSLQKASDMEDSFNIIENLTTLRFNSVNEKEQITITCSSEIRGADESGFFIAGEGGPVNITITDNFNVIHKGKILLLRDSKCPQPNVGIHELLHVLGFTHSKNQDSIMYEVSKCSQVITNDILYEINRLYRTESLPDLVLKNFTAENNGRYMDASFTVSNHGLASSGKATAILYLDDSEAERIDVKELEIGYGSMISWKNIRVPFGKTEKLTLVIESDFQELDKKNNKIELVTGS